MNLPFLLRSVRLSPLSHVLLLRSDQRILILCTLYFLAWAVIGALMVASVAEIDGQPVVRLSVEASLLTLE